MVALLLLFPGFSLLSISISLGIELPLLCLGLLSAHEVLSLALQQPLDLLLDGLLVLTFVVLHLALVEVYLAPQ